ncbi:hypothetical protein Tco_0497152 [Tanacetum coccineum]
MRMWTLRIRAILSKFRTKAQVDIIENGNSFNPIARTTTNADGTSTSTIPGPDAKTLFAAIQTRFGGNDATKKTQKTLLNTLDSTANLSDATVYAFLANQPNGSQLVHEDLEQIHEDDLEEMDLKWQLALLSMRARRKKQLLMKIGAIDELVLNGATMQDEEVLPTSLLWLSQIQSLASVEEQLVFYKKNEVMFCDQIAVLKRDASFKDSEINALNIQIEKLKKEKESNQIKIDNFENASKSLDKLIGSQISDNNRKAFNSQHLKGYGFKVNKSVCENSSNEIKKTTDAPIIEDWVSDCDEDDSEVMVLKSDNVQHKPEQANQPKKVYKLKANMDFCDKHNMVAFLQKLTGSEEFHQIVDFLAGSHIRYALTANPTIYVSLIEQFWQTVTVDTVNDGEQQLTVIVDGQTIAITEASIRRHLQLADADGISSLPNTKIFDQLTLMGGEGPTLTVESQHTPISFPPTSQPTTSQPMSSQEQHSQIHYSLRMSPPGSDKGHKKLNELKELVPNYQTKSQLEDDLKPLRGIYCTAGGLFSTAEEVQGKEQISTDEKVARKLNDEEMAREEQ